MRDLSSRTIAAQAACHQATFVMLKAAEGASVEEIVAAYGRQPHTVRGAIAGVLKKKRGLQIGSEVIEGRGRVYRIMP